MLTAGGTQGCFLADVLDVPLSAQFERRHSAKVTRELSTDPECELKPAASQPAAQGGRGLVLRSLAFLSLSRRRPAGASRLAVLPLSERSAHRVALLGGGGNATETEVLQVSG